MSATLSPELGHRKGRSSDKSLLSVFPPYSIVRFLSIHEWLCHVFLNSFLQATARRTGASVHVIADRRGEGLGRSCGCTACLLRDEDLTPPCQTEVARTTRPCDSARRLRQEMQMRPAATSDCWPESLSQAACSRTTRSDCRRWRQTTHRDLRRRQGLPHIPSPLRLRRL